MAFVCQQCKQPLQLDASLIDLTPSAYDRFLGSLPPQPTIQPPPASEEEKLAQIYAPSSSNESFVILQDSVIHHIPSNLSSPSQVRVSLTADSGAATPKKDMPPYDVDHLNPSPLSHHFCSTQRLLNTLSSRTDVDHPLCAECTHISLPTLSRQLEEIKKEHNGYIAFEKQAKKEKDGEKEGLTAQEAQRKIARLKEDELSAIERLREVEREREQLVEELLSLELEEKAFEEEEEEFWRAYNSHMLKSAEQSSYLASLRATYASDSATLERLERTNVYNDTFCIGHDGIFGTVNNLRLGRVPGVPVEWAEINAAWGQTLLLLYTIARKLGCDVYLGRFLYNRRFNSATVAVLECLKQIMDWVKSQDATVEFPHAIIKDKIGGSSVKLQFNQEESWTPALRHVLLALNINILLKWTTMVTMVSEMAM
ncbi:APG6-domain-containing protein [Russula earlei]|uniref:APG6-domain-containing protein n=1 Tax=Russula earlei TaxID=71964 RepID=A0ACC0U8P2_9AGAM|nr:APG6-domain-containing protein [Russula earlei]